MPNTVPTSRVFTPDETLPLLTAPNLGNLALGYGYLSPKELECCLALQQKQKVNGFEVRLGSVLLNQGYLTEQQLEKILSEQVAGQPFGNYTLIMKLGSGSFASVYKAVSHEGQQVALKVITNLNDVEKKAGPFFREARILQQLSHPNIVKVIEYGECGGHPFFALDYVEGESLKGYLTNRYPLSEELLLRGVLQVVEGLAYAWGFGVVHRDIKPANILLERPGKTEMVVPDGVKLIDFGIARIVDLDDAGQGEPAGKERKLIGTPYYMSPEMARGVHAVDHRSDMFSIGTTLYAAAVGESPFQGETAKAVIKSVISDDAPDIRGKRPDLSNGMVRMVRRLMLKEPGERYATYADLQQEIRSLLADDKSLS